MADDTETKRIELELANTGKISDNRLLESFGIDSADEKENLLQSSDFTSNMAITTAMRQAEAQGKAMEIQARYQVRAQYAATEEQAKLREEKFQEELANESKIEKNQEEDISKIISRYAEEISIMPQEGQNQALNKLQKTMPYTAAMVIKRLEEKMIMSAQMGLIEPETEETIKPNIRSKKERKKDEINKTKPGTPKDGSV